MSTSTTSHRISYRAPYAHKFERDLGVKELPTMKWKEQIDSCRMQEDFMAVSNKNENVAQIGLKNVMKLLREAEGDKMMARGKRVPLGNVSSNTISKDLQKKGESKRILKKIQSNLPELC